MHEIKQLQVSVFSWVNTCICKPTSFCYSHSYTHKAVTFTQKKRFTCETEMQLTGTADMSLIYHTDIMFYQLPHVYTSRCFPFVCIWFTMECVCGCVWLRSKHMIRDVSCFDELGLVCVLGRGGWPPCARLRYSVSLLADMLTFTAPPPSLCCSHHHDSGLKDCQKIVAHQFAQADHGGWGYTPHARTDARTDFEDSLVKFRGRSPNTHRCFYVIFRITLKDGFCSL